MQYRREIDGLRSVAVLPVILFHAGFSVFSGGYIGVDIFFVISGYLITSIIIGEMEQGRFSLLHFYERRARRILPALFVVILVCLPLAWLWLLPQNLIEFSHSLMAVATFSSNILFWQESGYFGTWAEVKPLLHTWSLAVEEQYYILFPLLLMVLWRFGVPMILLVLIAVFLISLGMAQWGVVHKPVAAFFLLPTRGWELLLGTFCAFYLKNRPPPPDGLVQQAGSLIGLGLIAYAVFVFDETTPTPGVSMLIPTLGTVLLILFANEGTLAYRILSQRLLVGLGLISYSAYLWHQPFFAFVKYRQTEEISLLQFSYLFALIIGLSVLSRHYVESPFRDRKKVSTKMIFTTSLAGLCGIFGLGLIGHLNEGFFNRVPAEAPWRELVMDYPHRPDRNAFCDENHPQFADFAACLKSRDAPPEVLIVGDSHSQHFYKSIAAAFEDQSVMLVAQWSCLPFVSRSHLDRVSGCRSKIERVQTFVEQTPSIELVIVAGYWGYLSSGGFDAGDRNVKNPVQLLQEEARSFVQAGSGFLGRLVAADKRVILFQDTPNMQFDIATCFDMRPFKVWEERQLCGISKAAFDAQNAQYLTLVDQIAAAHPKVEVFDPLPSLCDSGYCYAVRDGEILYHNPDHLTIKGADRIIDDFLRAHAFD